ncbi:hypothetical protein DFH11DRAFT_1747047 [Phellopilus nigrolimitatus]|nr:hypothetical protein DFH11DRAFT_1747047 [Phellopilus nigrolimitatus]
MSVTYDFELPILFDPSTEIMIASAIDYTNLRSWLLRAGTHNPSKSSVIAGSQALDFDTIASLSSNPEICTLQAFNPTSCETIANKIFPVQIESQAEMTCSCNNLPGYEDPVIAKYIPDSTRAKCGTKLHSNEKVIHDALTEHAVRTPVSDDVPQLEPPLQYPGHKVELILYLIKKAADLKPMNIQSWNLISEFMIQNNTHDDLGSRQAVESFAFSKLEGNCTYAGCEQCYYLLALKRHVMDVRAQYPPAFFCPACDRLLLSVSELKNHSAVCKEVLDVLCDLDHSYHLFNFYYLGAMDDFPISEEHFEFLAGRRRDELIRV